MGETVSDLAINADLAPTIVDVANANPGLVMDGRSLIPVAKQPGIERGRELLIEQPVGGAQGFEAIRTERYMYAEHNSGEKELYDLQNDPFELQSRHDSPRLRIRQGAARYPSAQAPELLRQHVPEPSAPEPSASVTASAVAWSALRRQSDPLAV